MIHGALQRKSNGTTSGRGVLPRMSGQSETHQAQNMDPVLGIPVQIHGNDLVFSEGVTAVNLGEVDGDIYIYLYDVSIGVRYSLIRRLAFSIQLRNARVSSSSSRFSIVVQFARSQRTSLSADPSKPSHWPSCSASRRMGYKQWRSKGRAKGGTRLGRSLQGARFSVLTIFFCLKP